MSIKRKLTMTMMGLSLAAVALTVLPITAYLIFDMRRGKTQELAVTAAVTGDRNSASLVFLDSERAERNLDIFHVNPAMLAACLYDMQGNLFADYHPARPGVPGCPASRAEPARGGMLTVWRDIEQNGEKVGSVFMAADTSEIDAYVRKMLIISGTVACGVLAITLMLTLRFQRTISAPILELARMAQVITERHDYTLQAPQMEDETGILAMAFNSMLDEVRARDRELHIANETLEQKVIDRTRQLEVAKSKAEAANAAKSEFLRNMSHEFRTPLHALISFSAYGIKEYRTASPDQLKEYFSIIQRGGERLSRLVGEVLDLARVEQGELRLLLARTDILELSMRACELVRPLLEQKQIILRLGGAMLPVHAMCDADKILQVLTNLLGNAIKFTPEGGVITLTVDETADQKTSMGRVTVRDEGIGIPPGEEEMIFESFRQSSRTNTGAGGTGLGLAICRGIVEGHGGRIWASGNKGAAGASVIFIIPGQASGTMDQNKESRHEDAA